MFVFRKIWQALFSCNTRDSPFSLITDELVEQFKVSENKMTFFNHNGPGTKRIIIYSNFCILITRNLLINESF